MKKTNLEKKISKILRSSEISQSSEVWIFSEGHVKNNVFHV